MNGRVEAIQKMLQNSPSDVFLHYSLGMEFASANRYEEALAEFKRCIELDENYLAGYIEAGKTLRSAGKLTDARELFEMAMELARLKKDHHMQDYIQQQLEGLPVSG